VIAEQGSSMNARLSLGTGDLSPRYDDALIYAAAHHRHQMRKGCQVPYLAHLMSVSALVLEHGGSEVAAIGGLLHDAVEDAPRGQGPRVLAEIEGKFGAEVAEIVRACSDGLDEAGNRSGTWVERKQPYLQALPHKTLDALRVTAADKTHNAGCIADDVRTYGQEFWNVFNACRHQILWYYGSVLHHFEQALPASTITASLQDAIGRLANAAESDLPSGGADLPRCGCTD